MLKSAMNDPRLERKARKIVRPQYALAGRSGITLIEVVASLALMATLLVALLQAKTGATQRSADARQKLAAVNMADQLLATWWADPKGIPVPARGTLPDNLQWETRFAPNMAAQSLQARVVRLQLFSTVQPGAPLVSVDILQKVPSQSPSSK